MPYQDGNGERGQQQAGEYQGNLRDEIAHHSIYPMYLAFMAA